MAANPIQAFVDRKWDDEIVPQLIRYIAIPNKSPMFDADWVAHGYMDQAVALMETWAKAQPIAGMTVEVVRLEGRTPLLLATHGGHVAAAQLLMARRKLENWLVWIAVDLASIRAAARNRAAIGIATRLATSAP